MTGHLRPGDEALVAFVARDPNMAHRSTRVAIIVLAYRPEIETALILGLVGLLLGIIGGLMLL